MKIEAIILDWAGTAVDFGSMAPVAAFREAFASIGLEPDAGLIRRFMGLKKRDHVRNILQDGELAAVYRGLYGKMPGEEAVSLVYGRFEPALLDVLRSHARPLPGVPETVARLRGMGIKIGSTTGYTREMMDVLCPVSESLGYAPDCLVCPDDVGGGGRPYPYMIWENLRRLGVGSIGSVVKFGDTAADIIEGRNAGCLSVGIVSGSNMLGFSREEYGNATPREIEQAAGRAREQYAEAGADYILEAFSDIPGFLENL